MPDDIGDKLDEMGKAYHEFKKANDERLEKVEKGLGGVAELKAKLDKMDEVIASVESTNQELGRIQKAVARFNESADAAEEKGADAKAVAEYKSAFYALVRNPTDTKAAGAIADLIQRKALSIQSEPDGGYTVSPDTSGRLVQFLYETSPMRAYASIQTTNKDRLTGFYDDDEADCGWEGETVATANTDTPQIGKWEIPVNAIKARPKATQDVLDDSDINLEQWLLNNVRDKFARTEATAFITGNGVEKPRGIMSYAHATTYARNTIQQVDVSDGSGALDTDNIIELMGALKGAYRTGAIFGASRATWTAIRKLKDGQDNYIWQPSYQAGQPAMLLGHPAVEFNDVADVASDELCLFFADLRRTYQIVDRLGFTVQRDPYTVKPYVELYCRKRVGGAVLNTDSIKIGKLGTPS